ncbi:MAG: ABC transporter permease, partial [Prolixibacteraceae bacterium]|nr:ABC transporter permease [Prolixibacteraceae bacterium]
MYRLLKIFTRSLLIRKVLSAITIGGFAISMSVIVILTVFIVEERNVNRSYPNVDNIYRLKMDNNSAQLPQDLLPTLKNEVPGIQKVCFYSSNGALYSLGKEKKLGNFIATNNEFIDIFSHKVLSYNGDINLDIKNQIVITESFRNKLFGAENPTGQVVELNGEVFNISAVISDPPKNSSFEFDGLIGINDAFGRSTWSNGKVTYNQLYAFVELNNKTNESSVAGSISKLLCTYEPWKDRKLLLQPFDEIYFDTDTRSDLKMANRNLITLLSWVALIILVMSIFNFVSLSVSTNIDRIDEIGIKKTMGANKSSIFIQHIFESMLVCMFAFILAIAIAIFISPIFSEIVGKHIDVRTIFTNPTIIV